MRRLFMQRLSPIAGLAVLLATGLGVGLAPGRAHAATISVVPGPGTPFQDALNAAQDGDVIVLRSGVYPEMVTRSDISNLTIRGQGRVIIDGGAVGGEGGEGDGDVLTFLRVRGLTITGLTIRNGKDDGIDPTDCSDVSITRCTFTDCGDSGIEDTLTQGILIEGCTFVRCDWGVAISYRDAAGSTGLVLRRNRFADIGQNAIEFAGNDALIERNLIAKCGGTGILLDSVSNFTGAVIQRNRIQSAAGSGIDLSGGSHVVVRNSVLKATGTGIRVEELGGNQLERNSVTRTAGIGIAVDCVGNTLTNNVAARSSEADLRSSFARTENTYTGNKFKVEVFAP